MIEKFVSAGFGETVGVYELKPKDLPEGESAQRVREDMLASPKSR